MCRYGCPETLITDQGREFVNELSDQLYQLTRTEHRITSAYHPQVSKDWLNMYIIFTMQCHKDHHVQSYNFIHLLCYFHSCRQMALQNGSTRPWVDAWPKCAMRITRTGISRLTLCWWDTGHHLRLQQGIHHTTWCFSRRCVYLLTWSWCQSLVTPWVKWKTMLREQSKSCWRSDAQQKQKETYDRKHQLEELPVGTEVENRDQEYCPATTERGKAWQHIQGHLFHTWKLKERAVFSQKPTRHYSPEKGQHQPTESIQETHWTLQPHRDGSQPHRDGSQPHWTIQPQRDCTQPCRTLQPHTTNGCSLWGL